MPESRAQHAAPWAAKIVGIFGIFVGIIVLLFPKIVGILAIFIGLAASMFPDLAYYPEKLQHWLHCP